MKLVGMLDSPYVRRVAISLEAMGVPFEHAALSVFSDYEAFGAINPVVSYLNAIPNVDCTRVSEGQSFAKGDPRYPLKRVKSSEPRCSVR